MTSITNARGERTMLRALREELREAEALHIAVAFTRSSGLTLLMGELEAALGRGARVQLLTSTYMQITQPEALWALERLQARHAGLACRVYTGRRGFHPKAFLFARADGATRCWVGSSNLTRGGLAGNIEWNLLREDRAAHEAALEQFGQLWSDPAALTLTTPLIEAYRAALRGRPAPEPAPIDHAPLWRDDAAMPLVPGLPTPNAAQAEALEALARSRAAGHRRAAVVVATGVGKTYLAAFDARAMGARRVLYVSHRLEHLTQAQQTFARVFADQAPQSGILGDGRREVEADHLFATVRGALSYLEDHAAAPELVVIDEFHHASAPSYQRLLALLGEARLLGLTATPERTDGQDVLALCDHNVVYELRLPEAIERGLLLPFHYFGLADEVDYQPLPWRSGRFDPAALEVALMVERRADMILERALEHGFDGPKRVAVGFCAGVRHARFMAERFTARGHSAAWADGAMELAARQALYARLQDPADPLEWLFVADLLNEGVDLPAINVALFLRPTDSATLFLQQLGRGLRLTPGCEVLTALDLVGNHRRAWTPLLAMHDEASALGGEAVEGLGQLIVPPWGCQIVLEQRAREVLEAARRLGRRSRDEVDDGYLALREQLGRAPRVSDCWGVEAAPALSMVRATYGDWAALQAAHGDGPAWLEEAPPGSRERLLLAALELDWTQQRVYAYALLWGALTGRGWEAFYAEQPRWGAERAALAQTSAAQTLGKKLGDALWAGDVLAWEPPAWLAEEALDRVAYWLDRDWARRHGGVLRGPEALVCWRAYTRQEVINHFGEQYDPTRHNVGVMELLGGQHIVIITKLDTTGARHTQQYTNAFLGERWERFGWQSQNRQRRDDQKSGQALVEHEARGIAIHLFVQAAARERAYYMGEVRVVEARGDAPIDVELALLHAPPAMVVDALRRA